MTDPLSIDDFENLCATWDQAVKANPEFRSSKPAKQQPAPAQREMPNFDEFEHDDPYFNYMSAADNVADFGSDESLLQEEAEDTNKKKTKKSANPVYPSSVGKDSDPKIWIDEEALAEVEKMKRKLYEIECKLNQEDGGGTQWHEKAFTPKDKALWGQIEKLRGQIDGLSDTLGLNYEPEKSLYRTDD